MTPVAQSKLVGRDGYGTCWTAALASVLDVPEHAVPHFADPARFSDGPEGDGEVPSPIEAAVNVGAPLGWWTATLGWLWMLGHELCEVDPTLPPRHPRRPEDPFLIASGLSPRSPGPDGREISHAVVYARQPDGSYLLAHDPYPDGHGLVGEPRQFYAVRPDRP